MKVKAITNGFDVTKGKVYEVIAEYDSTYLIKCDTCVWRKAKRFFKKVEGASD